jgi:hypothetical protein
VEGGHNYDRLNSSIQLNAAELLIQTTRVAGVASYKCEWTKPRNGEDVNAISC